MDATLSPPDIKALEQTRQRLSQLTNSLASLQRAITATDPLPPWPSLQSLATIIAQHLTSVSQHLSTHHDLFASMAVYPLPQFPGRTQENLLGQLLRKKLEPNVEDWVVEGRKIGMEAEAQDQKTGLSREETLDLWSWAGMAANEQARKHTWGGNYTLEEKERGVENVVTGLRRRLKEDPDDSSEEEDDEDDEVDGDDPNGDRMEIDGMNRKSEKHTDISAINPLPIQDVFRFMMTGSAPKG
ncbi:MAG: hypothetical protein Q9187_006754 [Circinaria calcarea]